MPQHTGLCNARPLSAPVHDWGYQVQIVASRIYPFLDASSLRECLAHDTLLRTHDGAYILHMTSGDESENQERLIWLDSRSALMWVNASAEDYGMEWR
jgi:hypothetical protein